MANERARDLRRNATPQERVLWRYLRERGSLEVTFRRQQALGPYTADFACLPARLIVEVDGGQHGRDDGASRDAARDAWLASQEYEVMRFWNHDVAHSARAIADQIIARAVDRMRERWREERQDD